MTLSELVREEEARLTRVREAIVAKVLELPDNPRITRLAPKNCFSIWFSDLGNNWSPEHHDFKNQYQFIADELGRKDLGEMLAFLRQIVDKGVVYNSLKQKRTFHEDVRKYIAQFIGDSHADLIH